VALLQLGRAAAAEQDQLQSIKILQRLANDFPSVPRHREDLANGHERLGDLYAKINRDKDAEATYRQALEIRERLARDDPGDVLAAVGVARTQVKLANLMQGYKQGNLVGSVVTKLFGKPVRYAEVMERYDKAIRLLVKVHEQEPDFLEARQWLSKAYAGRSAAALEMANPILALEDIDRAVATAAPNDPALPFYRMAKALAGTQTSEPEARLTFTLWLVRHGEHARAATEADKLLKGELSGVDTYNVACVFALCAREVTQNPPASGEQAKLAEKYAARSVELLQTAQAAAYFNNAANVEHMKKDSDLDPLRERADYKKLLADLDRRDKPGGQ
jgi:tetratricopeptide (TPR) repeat protein